MLRGDEYPCPLVIPRSKRYSVLIVKAITLLQMVMYETTDFSISFCHLQFLNVIPGSPMFS